jgi:two-component system, OmpR family, sensor kinase
VFDRISIRWRLALVSAGLTCFILCAFAALFGSLTSSRLRSDFVHDTADAATRLQDRLTITPTASPRFRISPPLELYASPNNATIRLFWADRQEIPGGSTPSAPDLGVPIEQGTREAGGYLIETRFTALASDESSPQKLSFPVWIEYARPLEDLESTINRLRLLLIIGVAVGTLLALLGGMALARRSLRPITDLTAAAQEIARTRDPDRHVPEPATDDEVAELARTFDQMLTSLEASRQETEGALVRQREFVADASHELRTPLTSILANLELLSDGLEGEHEEAASSALRSSQRMRRIVADLLLLARSDDQQPVLRKRIDLAQISNEATAEAAALTDDHRLTVEAAAPLIIDGDRDDLHRLVTNLVENAIRHTPAGTHVTIAASAAGDDALLTVADNGPGIAAEQRARIFERFVRRSGDRGGSTGLGLAIVRTVAEAHGGTVRVEDAEPGSRFVVRLPLAGDEPA